jgi:hypothetical protein
VPVKSRQRSAARAREAGDVAIFSIDIKRTSKISVDVEASSVEEAVRKVYEVMTPEDYHDSDDEIEDVRDDDGSEYYETADGKWVQIWVHPLDR